MDRAVIPHPPVASLKARRATGNTRAVRAVVTLALEAKPCVCGQPRWHVTSVQGRVRHLKCRSCGRTDKLVPPADGAPGPLCAL